MTLSLWFSKEPNQLALITAPVSYRLAAARTASSSHHRANRQQLAISVQLFSAPSSRTLEASKATYAPVLQLSRLYAAINTHDTVASRVSPAFGELCWQLYFNKPLGTVIKLAVPVGYLCGLVSIMGVAGDPILGWASVLLVPGCLRIVLLFNVQILRSFAGNQEFYTLIACALVFLGAMIPTVGVENPSRVFAVVNTVVVLIVAVAHDARVFRARNDWGVFLFTFVGCVGLWVITVMFWLNLWQNVGYPVLEVGSIRADVSQIGMSFLFSFNVYATKFAGVLLRSKENNQTVILKAVVSYRLLSAGEGRETEEQI
jgi:hypothetical protein